MYINVYNNMRGGAYDINDKRIPPINTQTDIDKIMAVDNNGNLSPVSNKGLFDLSSSDAGKYVVIDSNGNITASTQIQSELYTHYITMIQEAGSALAPIHNVVIFNITTLLATPFNAVSIVDYINSQYFLGPSDGNTGILANGTFKVGGNHHYVAQVRKGSTDGTINIVTVSSSGGTNTPTAFAASDVTSMTDFVVRIF